MKSYKAALLAAAVLSAVLLGGCYDDREIDETAYIIALGIDKADGDGYTYTCQFSAQGTDGGSEGSKSSEGKSSDDKGSGGSSSVKNIVASAPDFYTALNTVSNFLSKNTDMSHIKLIVFSQELDSEILSAHSQFLLREREIRPHTAVAVAKTTAGEFLEKINPELEANTAKYYELLALNSNNIYAPTKTLSDFVDELSGEAAASVLPLIHQGADNSSAEFSAKGSSDGSAAAARLHGSRPQLTGMAVFSGGILSGTMDSGSALLYNLLTGKIKHCTLALKNPHSDNGSLPFSISVPDPAVYSVYKENGALQIKASLALSAEYSGGRLPDGFESFDRLYAFAKKALEEQLRMFFYDISKIKKADILNIAAHFKKSFVTQKQWEAENWQQLYRNAEFEADIYFV